MLNLNTKIYDMIKKDAKENMRTIHMQTLYYLLLGKTVNHYRDKSFDELHKLVMGIICDFKTTG